jgi:hypothetical protein
MQLIHVSDADLQYGQSATSDDKDKCQQTIYIEVSINQACMHAHAYKSRGNCSVD